MSWLENFTVRRYCGHIDAERHLVLTALGTVSLLASAMNIRMSAKTISWSEDYYALDAKAEEYVH